VVGVRYCIPPPTSKLYTISASRRQLQKGLVPQEETRVTFPVSFFLPPSSHRPSRPRAALQLRIRLYSCTAYVHTFMLPCRPGAPRTISFTSQHVCRICRYVADGIQRLPDLRRIYRTTQAKTKRSVVNTFPRFSLPALPNRDENRHPQRGLVDAAAARSETGE
jgi:hypothetical protein